MEDTLYEPYGGITTCSGLIAMRGGWDQVTAQEATFLASLGCYPRPSWSEPHDISQPFSEEIGTGGGGSYTMEQPFTEPEPVRYTAPISEEPTVNLAQFFAGSDHDTNPMDYTGFFMPQTGIIGEVIKGAAQAIGGELVQEAIPQFGVTVTPGQACWDRARSTGKINSRMRVKLQRLPDGSVQVVRYCAPRRMNPCNPRALGRAARRLGMFQKMSSGIEKIINRQLKRKGSIRRAAPAYCGPRKGCR